MSIASNYSKDINPEIIKNLEEAKINVTLSADKKAIISYHNKQYQVVVNRDTSKLTETAIFKVATLAAHLLLQKGVFSQNSKESFERVQINEKGLTTKKGAEETHQAFINKEEGVFEEVKETYHQGAKVEQDTVDFFTKFNLALTHKPFIFGKFKKFESMYEIIKTSKLDKTEDIQKVHKKIIEEFQAIEHKEYPAAWAQKADLLDAIDLLLDKYPHANLLPIPLTPAPLKPWAKAAVPIIPYTKLGEATAKMEKTLSETNALGQHCFENLRKMEESLSGIAQGEHSGKLGEAIRFLTNQRLSPFYKLFGAIYRFMTRYIGAHYKAEAFVGSNTKKIAKQSISMGIGFGEILSKKLVGTDGEGKEVFFYRGPRYLFNSDKSIHQYQTVDDWFGRDLTPRARSDYLAKARALEKDISVAYGPPSEGNSRVVISNSDSRVRIKTLEGEEFSKPMDIVGKALSPEAAQQAKNNKDDPAYYTGTYQFNTNNLLGLLATDDLTPHNLNPDRIIAFEKETSETISSKTRNIHQQLEHQKLINDGQRELVAGMGRMFQREGAIQVIQRLAPADVHNYVASLKGKPLSHLEATQILQERISNNTANKAESEVFSQLQAIFATEERSLDRKTQTTIDIYGGIEGNSSVQTNAIDNKPSILSQNDRKIMLFKHEDESVSMHVFIGATGVNRVNVNMDSIQMEQGDQQGDMRPGEDIYQSKADSSKKTFNTTSSTTRDGIRKLEVGERAGAFSKQGSTVISYYLPTDFIVLPELNAFQELGAYKGITNRKTEGRTTQIEMRKEAEILCKMGDPLMIKTEIALAKYIEHIQPNLFNSHLNAENLIMELSHTLSGISPVAANRNIHKMLVKLLSFQELNPAELLLKEKLHQTLQQRLQILDRQKQQQAQLEKIGIDREDFELLSTLNSD